MNIDYILKDKLLSMLNDPTTMDINLFKRFINQFSSVCGTCNYNYIVRCVNCNKLDCYTCNYNRTIFKCEYCDKYYCYTCLQVNKNLTKCSKLCSNRYYCLKCHNLDICISCSTIKLIDLNNS